MKIEQLFEKWERYLTGEVKHQPGQRLVNHSVMSNIQLMVDDDFIFKTFNDSGLEMSENKEIYEKYFCSNEYLIRSLKKWHLETQSLYVRRITEESKRWQDTCSLMNLLTDIEKNVCHLNRISFCNFYKNEEDYANAMFDILSENGVNRKASDKISKNYIEQLKAKLRTLEILEVRAYTDQVVAHSDFKSFSGNLSMDSIQKCHKSIIEVYRDIELKFFLRGSDFGETTLWKELVLQKADKPFLINKKENL